MIDAYALKVAKPVAAYRKNPGPVDALKKAYFAAIEAALGIGRGNLWKDSMGRAFAGYAPVLSAMGFLFAEVENFIDIENKLRAEGTNTAWGVIEDVLQNAEGSSKKPTVTDDIVTPGPPSSMPTLAMSIDSLLPRKITFGRCVSRRSLASNSPVVIRKASNPFSPDSMRPSSIASTMIGNSPAWKSPRGSPP